MAIATTATAAPARPCRVRVTASMVIDGASAHSTDISPCAASPISSGLRRPTESEIGPITSWPRPRPISRPVMVSCVWDAVAPISAASSGSAGR